MLEIEGSRLYIDRKNKAYHSISFTSTNLTNGEKANLSIYQELSFFSREVYDMIYYGRLI